MEIISRRELFKRVAKLLPMMALPALTTIPIENIMATDCKSQCENTCQTSCGGIVFHHVPEHVA